MANKFLQILLKLNNSYQQEFISPSIYHQPQVCLPASKALIDLDVVEKPGYLWRALGGVVPFCGTGFSVEYNDLKIKDDKKYSNNLDMENIIVYMIRYKKKKFQNEKYETELHKPQIIANSLGNIPRHLALFTAPYIVDWYPGIPGSGFHLIYIRHIYPYTFPQDRKDFITAIETMVSKNLKENENIKDYALRFQVYIKLLNPPEQASDYIELPTSLFALDFDPRNKGYFMDLHVVEPCDYHINSIEVELEIENT